jgi:probable rRNA maturation factor
MSSPRPEGVGVEFSVEDDLGAHWDEPRIGALVRSIVAAELPAAARSYVIGLHLVSNSTIRGLNAAHRGHDAHTDVLSFPLLDPDGQPFVVPADEPANLGDVVVSYPTAVAQAIEFGHTTDREIAYLVAHGVLHVLGYDHEEEADRQRMRQREEEALQPLGFVR